MISDLLFRLRALFRCKSMEAELDAELRAHFEHQVEKYVKSGLPLEQAETRARLEFGGLDQVKEECRDARGVNFIETTIQDARYGLRMLRKSLGFTVVAVVILSLGMSGAVAIFGFADAALIKPLPYLDPSRLVVVFESSPGNARSIVSYMDFVDWKRLNNVFSSIDAYALNGGFTLTTENAAEQVPGTRVSPGFFHTLGVIPFLGRDFRAGEDSPESTPTVLLSYAAWQKRFGGRRDVLGQAVTLNGARTTIIGVLSHDFQFAPYGDAEFWTTLRASDACEQSRACHNLITIARLKDGFSIKSASSDMLSIVRQLQRQYPESNRHFGSVNLVPLRDVIVGDVRPILLLLLGGAGLLLLVACVNVSALLVVRSEKRRREIAVRGALGASMARLIRQFAAEGLVLVTIACVLSLISAEWIMRLLIRLIPADMFEGMPFLQGLGLNLHLLALTGSISLLTTVLFSVIPSLYVSPSDMRRGLAEGGRGSTGTMWRRVGAHLVVLELAIAVVLLVGAGLLGRSLYVLLRLDIGFRADHLVSLQTGWPPATYANDRQKIGLARQILDRISTLPGVKSVAVSNATPVDSAWGTASFHVAGRPNHGENNEVLNRQVSSGYFATLQARLLRGRYFGEDEDASKPLVAVANRALANRYFPGEDPVGKQIYYDWAPLSMMQIVGIVDDIKEGPLEGTNMPALYVPYNQNPVAWPVVLVRSPQFEAPSLPGIAAAIRQIDPFISVSRGETLPERISHSPAAYLHRSAAALVGAFAATAFLLSVVGLYGVVAYSVGQRTHEIGIRMALGARRTAVVSMVMKQGMTLAMLGICAGVIAALGLTPLMASLLYGVGPADPLTFLIVLLVLTMVAALSCFVPAWRASKVEPGMALRYE